jgi:hypothetical protein
MYPKRISTVLTDWIRWLRAERFAVSLTTPNNTLSHQTPARRMSELRQSKCEFDHSLPLLGRLGISVTLPSAPSNCPLRTRIENLAFGKVKGIFIIGYFTIILPCRGGVEVKIHITSTSAQESVCSDPCPDRISYCERHRVQKTRRLL